MKTKIIVVLAGIVLGCLTHTEASTFVINSTDRGYRNFYGGFGHDRYAVAYSIIIWDDWTIPYTYDYFVFDLSGIASGNITSASLKVWNPIGGCNITNSSATFNVGGISIPPSTLVTNTYPPLSFSVGGGYGAQTVSSANDGEYVTVSLNGAFIADAQQVLGSGEVALGGSVTGNSSLQNTWTLFFNSGTGNRADEAAQLVLNVEPAPPLPHRGTGAANVTNSFVIGVDILDGGFGYTNSPLVRFIGGGGNGAGAFAVVSNGVVTSIIVTNAGYGYTNAPLVVIEPPFIPNPVLGIAPMTLLTFSNLAVSGIYQLQKSLGWYWTNQPVNFTATGSIYTQMVTGIVDSGNYRLALNPVPSQAFATPQVVNGFVVGATVTSGGSGYVTSPMINIVGGGGTNATAISHLSGGVVTSISITSAGIGYTNTPIVQIAPPPAAAVSPSVLPVMRVDSSNLAPYDNYQIQFKSSISGAWNWNGGLFSPTAVTNSQFIFITNGIGFFRLQFQP